MKKVGLTGGIGSGKSTIAKVFEVIGIPIYYADNRAKYLMNHDQQLIKEIIQSFGKESYTADGLNRSYLASQVFNDDQNTKKINQIVHPAVRTDFANWFEKQKSPYVLQEAALLVDNGSYTFFDTLITIYAPIDLRIERVMQRDPFRTLEQIQQILAKQVSEEERQSVADYVIKNDNTDLVITQVLKIHKELLD